MSSCQMGTHPWPDKESGRNQRSIVVVCPACGEENRADARICSLCRELFVRPPARATGQVGVAPTPRPPAPTRGRSGTVAGVVVRSSRWWCSVELSPAGGRARSGGAGHRGDDRARDSRACPAASAVRPARVASGSTSTRAPDPSAPTAAGAGAGRPVAFVEEAATSPPPPLAVSAQWTRGPMVTAAPRRSSARRARHARLLPGRRCPYCQRMDRESFPAPAVTHFLAGVVKVRTTRNARGGPRPGAELRRRRLPSVRHPDPGRPPEKVSAIPRSGSTGST